MAGQDVTRNDLDYKIAQALVAARNVVQDIDTINAFLARVPVGVDGVDPLTSEFGYNADDVYLIRNTFQQLEQLKPELDPVLATARGLTGLL